MRPKPGRQGLHCQDMFLSLLRHGSKNAEKEIGFPRDFHRFVGSVSGGYDCPFLRQCD